MSRIVRQLGVWLNDVRVGRLTLDDQALCEFVLNETYRLMYPRPVLGQQFEDDLQKRHHARSRLPRWFSNLLPEGALRQLVERQLGNQEFDLLAQLGQDLPGAVRVEEVPLLDAEAAVPGSVGEFGPEQLTVDDGWHFSLAGVQLKFSATRGDRGMTIPVSGQGGNWILKLPHPRYPDVPRNEYATMLWARSAGITIPEIELLDLRQVSGLPSESADQPEAQAFAIRRFDRLDSGLRVHMEDFAQILDLYPEQKYSKGNHETIARLTLALVGESGLAELVRRMVFMLACGNGDAHHKNWSLLYPGGQRATLSPAYDLVSTIQYMPSDALALNFGRSKHWADMHVGTFQRMARKIGFDEARMTEWTQEAVTSILGAWHESASEFGYPTQAQERINQHLATIPLFMQ